MKKELTCIICPKGCALTATVEGEKVTITGNSCPRGEEYACSECLHPVRTVTATVRVENRPDTMVPVKTRTPVPKEKMAEVMAALRKLTLSAPISIGTVVAESICGSEIVTTKQIG